MIFICFKKIDINYHYKDKTNINLYIYIYCFSKKKKMNISETLTISSCPNSFNFEELKEDKIFLQPLPHRPSP